MIINETAVDQDLGIVYHARIGEGRYEIIAGIQFKAGMSNDTIAEDGKTIAQMRREDLHQKLDAWLDDELKEDPVAET
jgi:hypothetical protein